MLQKNSCFAVFCKLQFRKRYRNHAKSMCFAVFLQLCTRNVAKSIGFIVFLHVAAPKTLRLPIEKVLSTFVRFGGSRRLQGVPGGSDFFML